VKTSTQTATVGCAVGISPMEKLLGPQDLLGMRERLSNSQSTSAIFLNKRNKWSVAMVRMRERMLTW